MQLIKDDKHFQEWPLKSNLDPQIYGPPESAITTELVENEMRGFLTLDQVKDIIIFS